MATRTLALVIITLLAAPALAFALPLDDPLDDGKPPVRVRIDRDAFGVPHVYADDAYSLFWGNGYAQAEDRLFQLDVLRHVGKGESARVLGPSQLEMDLATRRELYTDEERTARFEQLSPEHQLMFQGFADGVTAFIEETRADPSKLSAEFAAIGHAPEDWVPEDTIAIAEYLLDIFGAGSGGNEVENAKTLFHLMETVGPEAEAAFGDFWWMHDNETYTTIDPSDGTYVATEGPLAFSQIPAHQWEVAQAAATATPFAGGKSLVQAAQEMGLPAKFGSNAIVVSPALSENGGALLLGGPQMAYYNPMVPYEVALHGAGFDAVGMGVGGAPGVIIGRNANMAWTVTSGSSDQVDVVAVKLVEGEPRRYYVSGASGATADMECRTEVHVGPPTAIDANPPVLATQEVCRTNRGPVFAINEEMGYAFVRERTHRLDELRSGLLWLTLAQNEDLASFQAHMETFRFEFNFHVATAGGDIAYFHWGANPVRDPACDPRLPRLAGMCDWQDERTGSELPYVVNPTKGYIVNWNNKPAQGWSGGDAMEKWGPVHRAELIERAIAAQLAEDGKLSIDDLHEVNRYISTRSPFPFDLVPILLDATQGATSEHILRARQALLDWQALDHTWDASDATCDVRPRADACFGTYEPGFAVYETWRGIIQDAMFRDELGPHVREMGFVPPESSDPHAADHGREDNKDNVLYRALTRTSQRDWCEGAPFSLLGSTESTCDAVLHATLKAASAEVEEAFGTTNVSKWRQPVHTIQFVGLSGGPAWRIAMVNRPSFQHYYDFGSGDAGSNLPPGTDQYWEPLAFARYQFDGAMPDAHKRDQLDLYVDFAYKPAQMTPAGIESSRAFAVG